MLLIDAWPDEITTMCFPLTAGRDVDATSRLVPFSASAVASIAVLSGSAAAAVVALEELAALLDVELLDLLLLLLLLHAPAPMATRARIAA